MDPSGLTGSCRFQGVFGGRASAGRDPTAPYHPPGLWLRGNGAILRFYGRPSRETRGGEK